MSTRGVGALRGVGAVTAGALAANTCAYLLHLPAGRWLTNDQYSEFAVLLQALLLLAVPALAVQNVIARERVAGASVAELRRRGWRVAVATALVAAAAVPVTSGLLHTSLTASASALVAAPVLVILGVEQGIMQGDRRFGALGAVLTVAGLGRTVPAVIALAVGGNAASALAASAAGIAVAAAAAWLWQARPRDVGNPAGALAVLRASQAQLVLISLTSMDLLLSRAVLNASDAGVYAVGAVATKVAFWLPSAVSVVIFPWLAEPVSSRRALRVVIAALSVSALLCAAGAAAGSGLVSVLLGQRYAAVEPWLWLFALEGGALAILQGALLYAIAVRQTRISLIAWIGGAIELLVIVSIASSVPELITVAAISACAITLAVLATIWRQRALKLIRAAVTPKRR